MIACAAAAAFALTTWPTQAQQPASADAVILITLDGARHEEIFGGLDLDILKSTLKKDQRPEDSPTYQRYWAATPEERRRKLLPFFWRLVTEQGSIAGNHTQGQFIPIQCRYKRTWRLQMVAYCRKHRFKELLQIPTSEESLFDIL